MTQEFSIVSQNCIVSVCITQCIISSTWTKFAILCSVCSSECFIERNIHIVFIYQVTIDAQYILLVIPDSLFTVYTSDVQSRLSEFERQDDRSNRSLSILIINSNCQFVCLIQNEVCSIRRRYIEFEHNCVLLRIKDRNNVPCSLIVHRIPFIPVIPFFTCFTTNQVPLIRTRSNSTLPYSFLYI